MARSGGSWGAGSAAGPSRIPGGVTSRKGRKLHGNTPQVKQHLSGLDSDTAGSAIRLRGLLANDYIDVGTFFRVLKDLPHVEVLRLLEFLAESSTGEGRP